jgi:DNA polymerase III delta prime subunit
METTALHTRFILTCNDVERLIKPLVSRCQTFHIQPPDKATVAKHVASILDLEKVEYEIEDFKILMKYHPDIRRIIQTAQQNSVGGKLDISEKQILDSDSRIKLLETLKSKSQPKDKLVQCRQILMDTGLTDFTEYYTYLYDNIDELAPTSTAGLITTIADYQYKDSMAPNKEINFAACIVDILKIL